MERLFSTHEIRRTCSLEGLWDFYPASSSSEKRKVWIPSCVETYPGYENYRGVSVFERELFLEGNVLFRFKGVSHTARIFLDGEEIGGHYNAYTPFSVLQKNIPSGKHKVMVTADNSCHSDSALHVINDYYNYGGISRPVSVESLHEYWIKRLHITPRRTDSVWNVSVKLRLENLTETTRETALCLRLDGEMIAQEPLSLPPGETVWEKTISIPDAVAYELTAPRLYTMQALLGTEGRWEDDLIDRFGFREIKIAGNRIYFNGQPLAIRGFNRHEDHASFGCAIPVEAMDYDLRLMEDMGANSVRTCHYPNDERFLDLCDEKGILVWEEGHARGLSEQQMRHPKFQQQSLQCLREMVEEHYNHPSIFTWGILNECASDTEYGRTLYAEQYGLLRSLDDTRPLTSATCRHFSDICLDLPDIVSVNIYPGWYKDESTADCLQKEFDWINTTAGAGKPLLISEIGAGSISGYHAAHRPKWSEERQSDILKEQLKNVLSFAPASGVFIWQFCDGRVPDENFFGRPCCKNNKGVVDEYRRRKLSYETVKSIFTKNKK